MATLVQQSEIKQVVDMSAYVKIEPYLPQYTVLFDPTLEQVTRIHEATDHGIETYNEKAVFIFILLTKHTEVDWKALPKSQYILVPIYIGPVRDSVHAMEIAQNVVMSALGRPIVRQQSWTPKNVDTSN